MYIIIHNGSWLHALLWGSIYYRHWSAAELGRICAPPLRSALYIEQPDVSGNGLCLTVAGDCTECEIASYGDFRLGKVVHSEKKKAPTFKLYFLTALNSFNLLHSAVYGGSATERAPAEAVAYSSEWQALFEPVDDLLVTLDRGFAYGAKQKLAPVPLRKGKKWLPAWVSKDTKGFTVHQVADNAVRCLTRLVLLTYIFADTKQPTRLCGDRQCVCEELRAARSPLRRW
jgi:hypothetical protein